MATMAESLRLSTTPKEKVTRIKLPAMYIPSLRFAHTPVCVKPAHPNPNQPLCSSSTVTPTSTR